MRGGKVRSQNARRYDREILCLAMPALGALAPEPRYVLATTIVGHLRTPQLAIAAIFLSTGLTLFNFLTCGTTAKVARLHGAGENVVAGRLGAQALHLGVVGVWAAINAMMAVRIITCGIVSSAAASAVGSV